MTTIAPARPRPAPHKTTTAAHKARSHKAHAHKAHAHKTAGKKPTRAARKTGVAKRTGPATGANPALAQKVKNINIQQYHKVGGTTFCNQAFNAYAHQMGYSGFDGKVANQMYKQMSAPGSGWHKVDAQGAIEAAKQGKLVAASWYNNTPQAGRPDGRRPGHVAAVIGEYAPGVPGIAQAGTKTFEWGPVTASRKNPTYFVRG